MLDTTTSKRLAGMSSSLTMKGTVFLLTASQLWVNSDSTSFLECAEHPKCLLEGFDDDGFCCPDLNGIYQDCCHRAECIVYPACYDAGVDGFCCPTVEGEYLDCCDDPANIAAPSLPPSQIPSSYPTPVVITANETPGACSRNAQCEALGLEGLCCPTIDNVHLDCCGGSAECSANSQCAALGLTGECCPVSSGEYLECCDGSSNPTESSMPSLFPTTPSQIGDSAAQCSKNSGCAALGLTGQCCPTVANEFLGKTYTCE
jgi:hypothetical protein